MSGTIVRQVKRNEVFTVELEEPSSSGYQWRMVPQDNLEVRGINSRFEDEEPRPGSPVTKVFFIQAQKTGEYELAFELVRPWEKNNPVRRHEMSIDVSEDR